MHVKDGNTNLFPLSMLKIESLKKGKNLCVFFKQTAFHVPTYSSSVSLSMQLIVLQYVVSKSRARRSSSPYRPMTLECRMKKKCTSTLDLCHINHIGSVLCTNIFMSSSHTFSYILRECKIKFILHTSTQLYFSQFSV